MRLMAPVCLARGHSPDRPRTLASEVQRKGCGYRQRSLLWMAECAAPRREGFRRELAKTEERRGIDVLRSPWAFPTKRAPLWTASALLRPTLAARTGSQRGPHSVTMPRYTASASSQADSVPPSTNARSRSKRNALSGTPSELTGPTQSSRWTVVRPWQPPTRRQGVHGASDDPVPSSSSASQTYVDVAEGETDEDVDMDGEAFDDWDNDDQASARSDPDEQDAIPGDHRGGRVAWDYSGGEHASPGAVGVDPRRQVGDNRLSLANPRRLDLVGVNG